MPDAEIVERLDTIIAILNLAFAEQIERARDKLQRDPTNAAILEALALGPVAAGELQEKVKAATGQAVRTIQVRLAGLVEQRAIERTGAGPRVSYRAIGPLAVSAKKSSGGRASDDA